jgi:broad specificity phosphatase PhoE
MEYIITLLIIAVVLVSLIWIYKTTKVAGGGGKNNNKQIFLVRHAQTDANAKHLRYDNYTPDDDIDINEIGIQQATKTGEYLRQYGPYDLIISSPRLRTLHTAKIIADKVGYTKPILESSLLLEGRAGIFNGKTSDEVSKIKKQDVDLQKLIQFYKCNDPIKKYRDQRQQWVVDNDNIIVNKYEQSPRKQIIDNHEKFINDLINKEFKKVIIVGHSGTIYELITNTIGTIHLAEPKYSDEFGNTSITYLEYGLVSPFTNTEFKIPKFYLVTNPNNDHLLINQAETSTV